MSDWIQIGRGWYSFAEHSFHNVRVKDIAHSLSQINRYTGNAIGPYSVARHSINGADYIYEEWSDPLAALYFLTHDAHECALSDIPRPVTRSLSSGAQKEIAVMKEKIDNRIHFLLNIPWPPIPSIREIIKRMDDVLLATEKRDIMPTCDRPWDLPYTPLKDRTVHLEDSQHDEMDWLARYKNLMNANELNLPETYA